MEEKVSLFSPYLEKKLLEIKKKYDPLNLSTMGEMKSPRFPHNTGIRYKKTCTIPTVTVFEDIKSR